MQPYRHSIDLRAKIQQRLDGFDPQDAEDTTLRPASVALVIAGHPEIGEAAILITLRSRGLNRHGGQYALPGGRLDPGETEPGAALRELHEELGLDLPQPAIMGRLDHFATRSGFRMAPIVMWAESPARIYPDPGEVAAYHYLPFSELDSPDIPRLSPGDPGTEPVLSAYFPTLGHHIYAPTAAILYQFREIALRGVTTRAAHFEHPAFAWK